MMCRKMRCSLFRSRIQARKPSQNWKNPITPKDNSTESPDIIREKYRNNKHPV